jgi:hypothetical protein
MILAFSDIAVHLRRHPKISVFKTYVKIGEKFYTPKFQTFTEHKGLIGASHDFRYKTGNSEVVAQWAIHQPILS